MSLYKTLARGGARHRAAFLAVPLFLALCTTLQAAEIETARGPVTIDAVPERIAVYDIAAIDTLLRLGVEPDGIPDKLYLPELKSLAGTAETVGTLFEPDLEALNALAPDLVIVGGRSSLQLEQVARVAQSIDMTIGDSDLVAAAKSRLAAYGALFDREDTAQEAAAELDAALERARTAIESKGTGLVLMTNGPKISAYGPNSRFGWIYTTLGMPPAAAGLEAAIHGEAVSFEFVANADPDWLIVVDRAAAIGSGEANARATLDNALVAGTKAWKAEQVVYLPAADVYIAGGGVQALGRVADTLAEAFAAVQ
ncbi:siderophore ABC transporter substrate-binding protein [Aurantimonas endophytica]|uniref:Iron complex transport system substrate-binding protein n=1 Tax=Aurantimonas endophytica TaxID=1522175 RepID=A0A7W6HA87_9HYPH|nr:siderophore ABC transporter substrate-binding protein [Aurantimonas endophytica]MBB4001213.1 iron complex transport system substrate-binding protein [Aurantimonas endophytica]MCO6403137.1 ABC transporter substrate-binding protein [Aurantimonas endophytica]